MDAEEFDRHLISYHDGGNDYRYCFSKQEAETIKNALNGYDKAIDDVMNMLNDIKFGGGTKDTLACANATLNYIKGKVENLRSGGAVDNDD